MEAAFFSFCPVFLPAVFCFQNPSDKWNLSNIRPECGMFLVEDMLQPYTTWLCNMILLPGAGLESICSYKQWLWHGPRRQGGSGLTLIIPYRIDSSASAFYTATKNNFLTFLLHVIILSWASFKLSHSVWTLSFGPHGNQQESRTKYFDLTGITSTVTHKEEKMVCDVSGQISSIIPESFKLDLLEQNIYSIH